MDITTFQVRKDNLPTTRLVTEPAAPLAPGQVRVRIDSFALTANNITYAALGDFMNYWQFYPTLDAAWGVIPVWGFATVEHSTHEGVAEGERLYGYWPMASHTVLTPVKMNPASFVESAPNRQALHGLYNVYMRTANDPFYSANTEDVQALFRPLFVTSFAIDDFLADSNFFGAKTMLLSSASSKTAYGTAHQLSKREGIEVVGLTSERNRAFCESLGCYHRVVTYESLSDIAADTPCVYVDFAGNADLRAQVHGRFTHLAFSSAIGLTHVDKLALASSNLPGPAPVQFFAPAQIKKRQAELGPAEFGAMMVKAWLRFCAHVMAGVQPWVQVEHHKGAAAVQGLYGQVLAGQGDARTGHIASL
jgi:hypothetical protein